MRVKRCLPAQDASCLLRFTAPLPFPVHRRRVHHGYDLFVGILRLPLAKLVEALPQSSHRGIDDLA